MSETDLRITCQVCGRALGSCRCGVKPLRVEQEIRITVGGLTLPIRRVTFSEAAPQIHRHYLVADKDADRLGWGALELCCHGCGRSVVVKYALPPREQLDRALADLPEAERDRGLGRARALAEGFRLEHGACRDPGGAFLCPARRTETHLLDWTEESVF
mgnify:CR=1 FL=1